MNDLSTAPAPPPAIKLPENPIDDAASHVRRTQLLLGTLDDAFGDGLMPNIELHTPASRELADRVMMLIAVAKETVALAAASVEECYDFRKPQPRTSMGKHVDIKRRAAWIAAADAYHVAEAAPYTDETFDAVGEEAARLYQAMLATPAPDLRAFHEKMLLIQQTQGWTTNGTIEALFADVERFALAEIASAKLEA